MVDVLLINMKLKKKIELINNSDFKKHLFIQTLGLKSIKDIEMSRTAFSTSNRIDQLRQPRLFF